jgi:hypothetical protein
MNKNFLQKIILLNLQYHQNLLTMTFNVLNSNLSTRDLSWGDTNFSFFYNNNLKLDFIFGLFISFQLGTRFKLNPIGKLLIQ